MKNPSRRRLLVVEDHEFLRGALAEFLASRGFRITTAADGLEAQQLLQKGEAPNVIVLDLSLPKLSGRELRQWQLGDPSVRNVPVVVLTGRGEEEADPLFEGVPRVQKATGLEELLAVLNRLGG